MTQFLRMHPVYSGFGTIDGMAYLDVDGTWNAATATAGPHATNHKSGGSDELDLNELGLPSGSIDFNGQQALSFRIENRTSDPVSPTAGQIWLRTDL